MANGPFSVNPQSVGRIQTVQTTEGASFTNTKEADEARIRAIKGQQEQVALRQEQLKETTKIQSRQSALSVAGSIANVASQASQVFEQVNKQNAIDSLKTDLQSMTDQLVAPSDTPRVDDSVFSQEANNDPDFREAVSKMRRTSAAGNAGKINRDFVVERYNEIVATAKSRNPIFGEELEKAARDLLGFSPQREAIAQLMSASPQEEAQRQLSVKAARLGIAPQDLQTMELSALELSTKLDKFKLMKAKGTYDGNVLASEVRGSAASVYISVSEVIAEQVAGGGVQDVGQMKSFIQQQYGAHRQQILANMPASVDASVVNAHMQTLNNEEVRLLGMVDSGSLVELMTNQKDIMVATAESDILNTPVLGKIYASLGKDAAAEVMGQITRFRTNPGALQAVFATGGKGAEALSLGLVLEKSELALEVVSGQRPAINEDEARVAAWFATKQLQTGNGVDAAGLPVKVDGTQAVRLVDVLKNAGQDVSVAGLNDPRVVRTVATNKETHGQVINMVDSYVATLTQEYNNLKARGEVPPSTLSITGNTITAQQVPFVSARDAGFLHSGQGIGSIDFANWVTKANRLMKMGTTYKGVGVLPQTKWTTADAMLNTLTTGVTPQGDSVPTPTTTIKWGLDANGNPTPLAD